MQVGEAKNLLIGNLIFDYRILLDRDYFRLLVHMLHLKSLIKAGKRKTIRLLDDWLRELFVFFPKGQIFSLENGRNLYVIHVVDLYIILPCIEAFARNDDKLAKIYTYNFGVKEFRERLKKKTGGEVCYVNELLSMDLPKTYPFVFNNCQNLDLKMMKLVMKKMAKNKIKYAIVTGRKDEEELDMIRVS